MKKRRTAVCAFLLAACATLGMGYAALTDSFTVYGDLGANINNENLVVVFDGETTNTTDVSSVDGVYCNFATNVGAIDGRTSVELVVGGLTTKGQIATAQLRVENRSTAALGNELDAVLTEEPSVNYGTIDDDMFTITATWADKTADGLLLKPITNVGSGTPDYNVLNVVVTLNSTPTQSVTASRFEITFTAKTTV